MGLESKEEEVLDLFFNEPTKHWHFRELANKAKISDDRLNFWLKKFLKEKLIIREKEPGKMSYYTGNYENPNFKAKKYVYGIEKLYKTGFLTYLEEFEAKTIILFGSFSKGDWHKESDIDIFIVNPENEFEQGKYELLTKREIQVFEIKNRQELKKMNPLLMDNIISGTFIKGNAKDLMRT